MPEGFHPQPALRCLGTIRATHPNIHDQLFPEIPEIMSDDGVGDDTAPTGASSGNTGKRT